MNSYLLSYDAVSAASIAPQLQAYVKASRHIMQWIQPYSGVYLLKAHADLLTLEYGFQEFFAGRTLHVLTPIWPSQIQGVMPPYVWDWLNRQEEASLGDILSGFLGKPE